MRELFNPFLAIPFFLKNGLVFIRAFNRRDIKKMPLAFSFNVSERCPNNCKCYWRARPKVDELSEEEVVEFFKKKRKEGYIQVTLIGGEPYVRPALLEKIAGIIPFAWLVTSGTVPLRKLRNTVHLISIDGLPKTHDRLRRREGLHDRIEKNLKKAREDGIRPIYLHIVLNHVNHKEIGDILKRWSENGLVKGALISTMTPINGAGDDDLRLTRDEHLWIVEELHRLKTIHGDFLAMTNKMIDRLHPEHTKGMSPEVCPFAKYIESYDGAGGQINPCVLSDRADCSECGCVVSNMQGGSVGEMSSYFSRITTIT